MCEMQTEVVQGIMTNVCAEIENNMTNRSIEMRNIVEGMGKRNRQPRAKSLRPGEADH